MLKVIFVAFKFLQSLEIENTLKNSALIFFFRMILKLFFRILIFFVFSKRFFNSTSILMA